MTLADIFTRPFEVAKELAARLQQWQSEIPGFAIPPESLPRWQRLGGYRTLPNRFFHAVARALESSAELRAVARVTATEIRQMLDLSSALESLAYDFERFARGIRYLAATHRASVGRRAVSAYRVAQGLNIVVSLDQPVPEAASMKQALTPRRRRRRKASSPSETIPLNAS